MNPSTAHRTIRRGDETLDDNVVVEEPLEIRVEGKPLAVTMRTPGHDLDLVAGFLYTEQVIDGVDDLVAMAHVDDPSDPRGNTVDVRLSGGVDAHRARIERATREAYASSACGVCGKASIDRLLFANRRVAAMHVHDRVVVKLPGALREAQTLFATTGGLHGAGLFTADGALELCREDVGRHNAVDKVIGARLRAGRAPITDRALVVSGRVGFEIAQKALVAGIPVIVAVGAPSTMAIDLALGAGMALYGFVRDGRFNCYA